MERLTYRRDADGRVCPNLKGGEGWLSHMKMVADKLCAYEDAEEQGLLVRVVRCRDCKHHDPEDMKCDCGGLARIGCDFALDDNYFCAYGEPREEAEASLAFEKWMEANSHE